MRIAHLTTVDLSLRYLILPQLEEISNLGGDAIAISAPGPHVAEIVGKGIRHIPLLDSTRSVSPVKDFKTMLALWKILRTENIDVLHTHTPKPGIYGRVLGRLAGVPVVVNTIHGLYATRDDPLVKRMIVYTLEAVASRFSDRELVQSREDFEFVVRRRITIPVRTILLGNGVDLERFARGRVSQERRRALRESIGAAPDDIVVGSVGRLVAEKGFPELFEAAESLQPNCIVVAIGPEEPDKDDGLGQEVIERARANGVQFTGMVDNADEWYAAMDIFVLASHREGFPRAAMEAAATGLPVIATDIRGCREVVDDDGNGILVPVNDPSALANAINRLASSADLRHRMSQAATTKAALKFDEKEVVRIVMAAQISALRGKGRFDHLTGSESFEISYGTASRDDAAAIASLHAENIRTGFLPTLGVGFLTNLYHAMIAFEGSTVIVARDPYGPVAFVAGVSDVGAFYKHFVRTRGVRSAFSALGPMLRPSSWKRVWETSRYDGDHHETGVELLSMAVSAPYQRRGLGRQLVERLLARFEAQGHRRVKVVVGSDNVSARHLYASAGFEDRGTIEVHEGEVSNVMVSTRS